MSAQGALLSFHIFNGALIGEGHLLERGAYFEILKNRNSEIKSIKNNKFLDWLDGMARISHNFGLICVIYILTELSRLVAGFLGASEMNSVSVQVCGKENAKLVLTFLDFIEQE